jgi:hypothetical protein
MTSCKKDSSGKISIWWQKPFYDSCQTHTSEYFKFYINGTLYQTGLVNVYGSCSNGIDSWGCGTNPPSSNISFYVGKNNSQNVLINYECYNFSNINQIIHSSSTKSFTVYADQCNNFELKW